MNGASGEEPTDAESVTETSVEDDRVTAVEEASADGDQLVTVAVPPDEAVGALLEAVEEDIAAEERLEKNVPEPRREALDRTRRELADYDETPPNGLVVYAGVVEGDLRSFVFEDPPSPVPERVYTHGNEFDTGPLSAAPGGDETHGLLVVERDDAALGTWDGETVTVEETIDGDVPGKTRAGGQSAERFERRREQRKREFFDDVGDAATRRFLDGDAPAVEDLFLGGTTVSVEAFREGEYLDHRLADRVVDTFHVDHAGEQGLRELAEKADAEALEHNAVARNALDDLFGALGAGADEGDPVAVGPDEVDRALTFDAVETLLVSETIPVDEREHLRERVEEEGGDCVVVPTAVDRGERLDEAFDGVAAVLRFQID